MSAWADPEMLAMMAGKPPPPDPRFQRQRYAQWEHIPTEAELRRYPMFERPPPPPPPMRTFPLRAAAASPQYIDYDAEEEKRLSRPLVDAAAAAKRRVVIDLGDEPDTKRQRLPTPASSSSTTVAAAAAAASKPFRLLAGQVPVVEDMVRKCLATGRFVNESAAGLGKTAMTVAGVVRLGKPPMVVVGLGDLEPKWKREAANQGARIKGYMNFVGMRGTRSSKEYEAARAGEEFQVASVNHVYLHRYDTWELDKNGVGKMKNVEGVQRKVFASRFEATDAFLHLVWTTGVCLVGDEIQKTKNDSIQSRAFAALSSVCTHVTTDGEMRPGPAPTPQHPNPPRSYLVCLSATTMDKEEQRAIPPVPPPPRVVQAAAAAPPTSALLLTPAYERAFVVTETSAPSVVGFTPASKGAAMQSMVGETRTTSTRYRSVEEFALRAVIGFHQQPVAHQARIYLQGLRARHNAGGSEDIANALRNTEKLAASNQAWLIALTAWKKSLQPTEVKKSVQQKAVAMDTTAGRMSIRGTGPRMNVEAAASSSTFAEEEGVFIARRLAHQQDMARKLREYGRMLEGNDARLRGTRGVFPFARFTHAASNADLRCSWMRSSVSDPQLGRGFLGVRCDQDVRQSRQLLAYPGVLMTQKEYDDMPYYIPTGVELQLPNHAGRNCNTVLVGFPDQFGPAIMDAVGSGRRVNCQLDHLEGDVGFHWEETPADQPIQVPDNLIHVSTVPSVSIRAGDELLLSYGSSFWGYQRYLYCCVCDDHPVDSATTLTKCEKRACTNHFHRACVGGGGDTLCPLHSGQQARADEWARAEMRPFLEGVKLHFRRIRRPEEEWAAYYFVEMTREDLEAVPGRPDLFQLHTAIHHATDGLGSPFVGIVMPYADAHVRHDYLVAFRRECENRRHVRPNDMHELARWARDHHPSRVGLARNQIGLFRTWPRSAEERAEFAEHERQTSTTTTTTTKSPPQKKQ